MRNPLGSFMVLEENSNIYNNSSTNNLGEKITSKLFNLFAMQ